MSESFSTVHHPSPPAFFPYPFDADRMPGASLAPPRSPAPTVPIGRNARVTPAIALYLMVSCSSFWHHLGWTPTRVLRAPPLAIAPVGSPYASRIDGWCLELNTLALAESAFQAVDMLFYLGNGCIHDLCARTICEMVRCPDITIVSDLAIPLVAWFVALSGQKYPDHINVSPAVHVHTRVAERLTRSMRRNRTNVAQGEHCLTARQISRARTAWRRYQARRSVLLEDRRVELVDGFLVGMMEVLEECLAFEDRLCFQQVHDGQEEACRCALAEMCSKC